MRHPLFALGAALAIAGCAAPAPLAAPAADGFVTVTARLAARRALLDDGPSPTAVAPWTEADVDNAEVTLFHGTDATALVSKRVEAADFDQAITFARLAASTDYRIEVQAWKEHARTTRLDALATDADSCTTTFTTGTGANQNIGGLKLALKKTPFSGATAELPLEITEGPLGGSGLRAAFPEDLVR